MVLAREFWKRIETLHAVTYFAPESIAAAKTAGLRGFWMGYFGFRASPLGAVGAGVVEAAFANFAPDMVRRSIPDAWEFANPEHLISIRSDAAAEVLRRLAPDVDELADEVNDRLGAIIDAGIPVGRSMFAANRDVDSLPDPVAQLWQHCTTLREHRGDGHVMALATAGLDGCEAHQLLIASHRHTVEVFRDNRGWTAEQWEATARTLRQRGLLDGNELTDVGRRLHDEVERLTDSLAADPLVATLAKSEIENLIDRLTPVALQISSSGVLPFPNPMALPSLAASTTTDDVNTSVDGGE